MTFTSDLSIWPTKKVLNITRTANFESDLMQEEK